MAFYWSAAETACLGGRRTGPTDLQAPRFVIGDNPAAAHRSGWVTFVNAVLRETRQLYAPSPDQSYTLNLDRTSLTFGETYLPPAWAEDDDNQSIGEEERLELNWLSKRYAAGFSNLTGLQHLPARRRSTPMWLLQLVRPLSPPAMHCCPMPTRPTKRCLAVAP